MDFAKDFGVIADIGGTNARFALCNDKFEVSNELILPCADYESPAKAVKAYLEHMELKKMPTYGAFAVASAVLGDEIDMTNHVWKFSVEQTRKELRLKKLEVVNDFVAQALAIPNLQNSDLIKVGEGEERKNAPIGVIGAGTGLGVSILLNVNGKWEAIASEGGHVTMAPANSYESDILSALRHEDRHISAERVISGSGLVNLHNAIAKVKKQSFLEPLEAPEISARAIEGDENCKEALELMFEMMGTVSGNLALTAGALGGIYIAGGIVPRKGVLEIFKNGKFRKRFEEKGRFLKYMKKIPTFVVVHEYPAFLGLSYMIKKILTSNI
jgi:glucokinase